MRSNGPMGLIIWDGGDDFYSHTQLAGNWDALENHDHTPGKGVQLQGNSLANNSVTGAKIAPNSISSSHIVDLTIQGQDIGDGQIGITKLDPSIFNNITPLGTTIAWFRPDTSIGVPSGWVFADGRVVAADLHGWEGVGNVSVPDLRGRFILGSADGATGGSPSVAPVENEVGGANVRYFNHTHTVPAHSHSVNAHSHTFASHSHSISVDGQHNHGIHSRQNALDGNYVIDDHGGTTHSTDHQSLYIAGFGGAGDTALPAVWPSNDGAHSHGANTGDTSGQTSSDGASTNSVTLTTNSTAPGGDIRPAYVGLLYIVKIKHT
jgi:microcystin-dependent protein